jgi:hypothetical protein
MDFSSSRLANEGEFGPQCTHIPDDNALTDEDDPEIVRLFTFIFVII